MITISRVLGGLAIGSLLCAQTAPSGCNQAQAQPYIETACAIIQTAASTPGLVIPSSLGTAGLQAAVAACAATGNGTNLSVTVDTSAILTAVVILEPLLIHVASTRQVARPLYAQLHKAARKAGYE